MVDQNTALWAFAFVTLAYIGWIDARPFYNAYRDRNSTAKAIEVANMIRDVRAADSQPIRNLLEGSERDKFVALLQSGAIRAWSRSNNKLFQDLSPLDSNVWLNHKIVFVDIDGKPQTLLAGPKWNGGQRPWVVTTTPPTVELTNSYDIHFNKAELKTIWPSVNF